MQCTQRFVIEGLLLALKVALEDTLLAADSVSLNEASLSFFSNSLVFKAFPRAGVVPPAATTRDSAHSIFGVTDFFKAV